MTTGSPLRVCTYNIRFILDRYDERRELVESVIESANADIYGFQEVLVGGQLVGQQKDIVKRLNNDYTKSYEHFDTEGFRLYTAMLPLGLTHIFHNPIADLIYDLWALFNTYFLCAITGPYTQYLYHHDLLKIIVYFVLGTCWVFGTSQVVNTSTSAQLLLGTNPSDAVQVKNASVKHYILRVGGFRGVGVVDLRRVIQTTKGDTDSTGITIRRILHINVHLSSAPHEEDIRTDEAQQIMNWLKELEASDVAAGNSPVDGVIISGDFNAQPDGKCYTFFMDHGFHSAYRESYGAEPAITFHQQHSAPTKDVSDECCLDYIMYRGDCLQLQVTKRMTQGTNNDGNLNDNGSGERPVVELIGTESSTSDPTLYPSDHYGIVANFNII